MNDYPFEPSPQREAPKSSGGGFARFFIWFSFIICAIGVIGLIINPVNNATYRALGHLSIFGFMISSILLNKQTPGRVVLGLIYVGFAVAVYNSEFRPPNPNQFTNRFVSQVKSYNKVRYRFGGESFLGMDSSGLVRRSLIVTYLKLAFFEGKVGLVKRAYSVWMEKIALSTLMLNENPYTKVIGTFQSINSLDSRILKNGDLAISSQGTLVAIYLGNKLWATSDSSANGVFIERMPANKYGIFRVEVKVVRFKDSIVAPAAAGDTESKKQ